MAVEISYADFSIIAVMIIFGFEGYRTGLFNGILSIGGLNISLIIAVLLLPFAATFYNYVIELPPNISVVMGFVTIFVAILLLYAFFAEWLRKLIKMEVVDWFNRISGTIIGLYKGLITASLLSLGFSLLPPAAMVKSTENNSVFMRPVKYVAPYSYNHFRKLYLYAPSFEATLQNSYTRMQKEPDEMAKVLIGEFRDRLLQKNVEKK
jgi:uncharacterized membrane protein required for colicin V production